MADGLLWAGGNNYDPANRESPDNAALLKCFDARSGELLYQYKSPRLGRGPFHDPDYMAMFSTPLIEGDRLWFVSNRHEVICMDIAPLKARPPREPEIVWKVDMLGQFGIDPFLPMMYPRHESCIPTSYDGLIFVTTNNGVTTNNRIGDPRTEIPAPDAPGLVCFDSMTGEVRWTKPTGGNVLLADMASPLAAEISGRGQVVVPHGDGWVRSYDPPTGELLWEFDINSKEAVYTVQGRSDRDYFLATPVLYEDRIYIARGRTSDDWLAKAGRLVCINTSLRGDISSERALDADGNRLPRRRIQAVDSNAGERAVANPDSGLIWEFSSHDFDGDGRIHWQEEFSQSISNVSVHDDLLIAADYSGLVHCLDARTGKRHWYYDTHSGIWASPLIVDGHVYVATDEGDVHVFRLSSDPDAAIPIASINMGGMVVASPIFVDGILYLNTDHNLYAIQESQSDE